MRLIDADAQIKRMTSVMDMQDVYLPIHFKELLIDDAPTVDAVPVEWIKHYMEQELTEGSIFHRFMAKVLKDWEEENDKND